MKEYIDINGLKEFKKKYDEQVNDMIAADYDNTATYSVGAYCIHAGKLYVCNTAISTAEDFDSTHWTEVKVDSELANLASKGFDGEVNLSYDGNNHSLTLPSKNGTYKVSYGGSYRGIAAMTVGAGGAFTYVIVLYEEAIYTYSGYASAGSSINLTKLRSGTKLYKHVFVLSNGATLTAILNRSSSISDFGLLFSYLGATNMAGYDSNICVEASYQYVDGSSTKYHRIVSVIQSPATFSMYAALIVTPAYYQSSAPANLLEIIEINTLSISSDTVTPL